MGITLTRNFWQGRRVLLTGHTGFKGAWTALWLEHLGAEVTGLALNAETDPNLFEILSPWSSLDSCIGDIRTPEVVRDIIVSARPQIVLHMAAQALVRRSYQEPLATFETNVMGTVLLLDALRTVQGLQAVLVVTSDKVYRNRNDGRAFVEDDSLMGDDPYSASKVGTEMVVNTWGRSFLEPSGVPVVTVRAGNVIGGGDWGAERLVPDLWRAVRAGASPELRYPEATRPWQHVLDPVSGYLAYAERLALDGFDKLPRALNFGPPVGKETTVGTLADKVLAALDPSVKWVHAPGCHPSEKQTLKVDASLACQALGWMPKLNVDETVAWTADWYRAFDSGEDMRDVSLRQILTHTERLSHP